MRKCLRHTDSPLGPRMTVARALETLPPLPPEPPWAFDPGRLLDCGEEPAERPLRGLYDVDEASEPPAPPSPPAPRVEARRRARGFYVGTVRGAPGEELQLFACRDPQGVRTLRIATMRDGAEVADVVVAIGSLTVLIGSLTQLAQHMGLRGPLEFRPVTHRGPAIWRDLDPRRAAPPPSPR